VRPAPREAGLHLASAAFTLSSVDAITEIHLYVGWSVPIGFGVLTLWSLWILVRNRVPHDWYWSLLAILQVVVGVQFIVGAVLFLSGRRPVFEGATWLHYVYGAFFPAALLLFAHRAAQGRFSEVPFIPFGIAAFLCCGLTVRALMTGLGM
jgi:hypothetical protein